MTSPHGSWLFPAFLKLAGRSVLVVGGSETLEGKVLPLLEAGAEVSVVAPVISFKGKFPGVTCVERDFDPSDVDGKWYVVAEADEVTLEAVVQACERRQVFVNVVDDRRRATAYLGSVIRREGYVVAISSGGQSPAVAKLLRQGLERLLPEDLEEWTVLARRLRERWRGEATPHPRRVPELFKALLERYSESDERGSVD